MSIGKIFVGVFVIVIGIALWFMLATPQGALTQVLFSTPADRFAFTETFSSFQFIYFLIVMGAGIGIILWGSQT